MRIDPVHFIASALLAGAMISTPAWAEPAKKTTTNKVPTIETWSVPQDSYKDLPGVKSQEEVAREAMKPSYTCKTDTVLMRGKGTRDFHFLGSGMPRTVYNCTTGNGDDGASFGLSYTGSEPPKTGAWLPGINPRDVGD
ncbi:hypothetical protein [Rhizobium sp.]|jgi:hypothetical protein|uniref:hypothetical protein n=1 Tax=Rhizobium sp. TaxID=391 RepID=UPI000E881F8D|nr:hypothetical protein [Rhizobium sp.]